MQGSNQHLCGWLVNLVKNHLETWVAMTVPTNYVTAVCSSVGSTAVVSSVPLDWLACVKDQSKVSMCSNSLLPRFPPSCLHLRRCCSASTGVWMMTSGLCGGWRRRPGTHGSLVEWGRQVQQAVIALRLSCSEPDVRMLTDRLLDDEHLSIQDNKRLPHAIQVLGHMRRGPSICFVCPRKS